MKKFLAKTIVLLLPLLLSAVTSEFFLRHIPNDYSYKRHYLDVNSNNIEVLFLGSSHALYGVNPSYISKNAFNASYVSQSLDYDYEILKKYENNWSHLEYIVIPVDYFTLFSRLSLGVESWRVKNYSIYYDIDLAAGYTDNFEVLSVKPELNLKRLRSFYIENKETISCTQSGYGKYKNVMLDLEKTGIVSARRHTKSDFKYLEANTRILKNIIAFASDRKIRVVIYTSPAYHTYVSRLNKDQLNTTFSTIASLVNSNQNCAYYNFFQDDTFQASDFRDADHLNEKGAKKLSIKFKEIVGLR